MDQLISSDPTHIGPYRLIARLGAGGMGLVYLGRSEAGRTVAVKVVQAEHAQHPDFRRRFAREVAAARKVGGAWTAAVLDADTDAEVPWVATQYIPGPDLTTVVATDFGPLPEDSVRVLANRLALALQAVHEAGLIHRDLKPSNVLVTVDGPRVIDFGIARAMDSLAGDSLHTRTGMLIGSPGFMSPEQVRGLELTPASDVFCLGAVLVFAATGRLLFGATETGLHAHLFRVAEEEPDLTGVPASLLDLVRACLDKDPAARPTLPEVATRTAEAAEGEWLPGSVLAQLGRHAAQLLDFAPETALSAAAVAAAAQPHVPDPQTPPPTPPPPAYAPTTPARFVPPQGFGPPLGAAWPAPAPGDGGRLPHPKRWWGLAVVALVQLLVLFDATSLRVALPWIVRDLHLPTDELRTMTTAYALAFGGLLLLGGHLADLIGRKRMVVVGLSGFAVAAVVGGLAPDSGVLIAARTLQGLFAALLSPAALGLVLVNFTEPKARARAFGVYAATAAGGSAVGQLAGGWLATTLSWRWCLYAAVPLTVIALIGTATLVHDHPARTGPRLDVPGLLLGSGGILALVYGCQEAAAGSWVSPLVLVPLAVGAALLVAFVQWQRKTAAPLLPPYVLADRDRLGALLALFLAGVGAFALLPTLTEHLGSVRGYPPSVAAAAMLPAAVAMALGATQLSARLLHRVPPRHLIVPGLLLTALGLLLLTRLGTDSGYVTVVLPGMLLAGLGMGVALMPLLAVATDGVAAPDSGAGAAVTGAANQVGGMLGAALFGSVVSAAVAARMAAVPGIPPGLVAATSNGQVVDLQVAPPQLARVLRAATLDGYATALWCAIGGTLLAALVAGLLVRTARSVGSVGSAGQTPSDVPGPFGGQ
ncbi:MDR family MFS transporter [Streptomyces sp. x-19]|uniref:MDR family MFS transporter n=1 Tax=Streptomyces sp. x-19 TaxID=2789280 RepID=UPI00397F8AD4